MGTVVRKYASVNGGMARGGRCDIKLTMSDNGVDNHVLELTLKLSVRQRPLGWNPADTPGIDLKDLVWTETEWSEFKQKFAKCARFWHRQFCLIPPDSATELMYSKWLGPKFMCNVECELNLEILNQSGGHHAEVIVQKVKAGTGANYPSESGVTGAELASTDADPQTRESVDGAKLMQIAAAHEIGHLLGQPHIGQLKNAPACQQAMKLNLTAAPDRSVASYLIGGPNAPACYGYTGKSSDIPTMENIMGLGMRLEEVNAITWKNALAIVLWGKTALPAGWKTVMRSRVDPRLLP